jgi:hypothetical protein
MRRMTMLLAVCLLSLTVFSGQAQDSAFTPPLGYPPNFPPNVNPLTGLAVEPEALARRPLIVKISNAPDVVRPQDGVGMADVVWEHIAEGGLTRFSAIFYTDAPPRIGSVRSARLIDEELTPMYDALLAYSGASPGTQAVLNNSDFAGRLYGGNIYGTPLYNRDFNIAAPHNLFIDPLAIWNEAAADGLNQTPDLRGNVFSDILPPGFTPGSLVRVNFVDNQAGWLFDPSLGRYLRFNDGVEHYDAYTNEQVSAANVVVLYAPHQLSNIEEGVWNGIPIYGVDITLTGEGEAIALRDGLQYPVIWRRENRDDLLTLWTLDGQPFGLKPGNTWFEVFPPPASWSGGESVEIG